MEAAEVGKRLGCARSNVHETQTRAIKKINDRLYLFNLLKLYTDLTESEILIYLKSLNGRQGYNRKQRLDEVIRAYEKKEEKIENKKI